MTNYHHCKSYALIIEVHSSRREDAEEVLELILKLKALVNDHTIRTALVHDLVTEPLSDEPIVI